MDVLIGYLPVAPEGFEYIAYIFQNMLALLLFKTVLEGFFELLKIAIKFGGR